MPSTASKSRRFSHAPAVGTKQITFGISVSPAVQRAIEEMLIARREFSRSKLIRAAIVEKAERELPSNWREIVGLDAEESAA